MAKRPLAVTIIAWFLIITSAFGLYSALAMSSDPVVAKMLESSPLSAGTHQAIGIISALVALVSGYGMLKGFNWSRYLYLAATALGIVINLVTFPVISIILISLLILAVIAFFLFRPNANAWFSGSSQAIES